MVVATMKLAPTDYYRQYVGVTHNVSYPGNLTPGAFIARGVVFPGDRASNQSNSVGPSVTASRLHGFTASRLLVKLNQGDQLRTVGFQSN